MRPENAPSWFNGTAIGKALLASREVLASREDVFPHYTREGFESSFREYFDIENAIEPRGAQRVLYLMTRRAARGAARAT